MEDKLKNKKQKVYRIGIDARFFGLENKGLGRYTNELVEWCDYLFQEKIINKNKKNIQSTVEFYIFLRKKYFQKINFQAKNFHKVLADFHWYSWSEQLQYPFLLRKYNLDLMHFTHFNIPWLYRGKFLVTIHDLILFHYPTVKNTTLNKLTYFVKLSGYHFLIRLIVRRADKIIAISNFTKNDIIKTLKVKESKIEVVYEGAKFAERNTKLKKSNKCEIFKKYDIIKPYLLYVGNAYPHKNLERLVLSFQEINKQQNNKLQLVLVGRRDYFYKRLKNFIIKHKIKGVVITGHISDDYLECLYGQAKVFVFPSLYEGFGLPPLEALFKGVPVVASDQGPLPEILENNVNYFNPLNIQDMVKVINNALQKGNVKIKNKQINWIKKRYNWKKMSQKIIKIYFLLLTSK